MSSFSWDIEEPEDRARYYWPQAAVEEWWQQGWDWDRLEATLQKLNEDLRGALLKDSPASQAAFARQDADLEHKLVVATGSWLTEFGTDTDNKPLRWDPFHLPLFDPVSGALSPKHPDYQGDEAWSEEARALFRKVLLARMIQGMASGRRTPLQGIVSPPGMDLSAARNNDGTNGNEPISADLSFALIASGFAMRRRSFIIAPDESRDAANVQTFAAIGTKFGDRTVFEGARFGAGANFGAARFGDRAIFLGTRFGDGAVFWGADFGARAVFWGADFGKGVVFWRARFGARVAFRGARFGDRAIFWDARFDTGAIFQDTHFGVGAIFWRPHFGANANFRAAHFGAGANFWDARFGPGANFAKADLSGSSWRGVDLTGFNLEDATLRDCDFANAKIWLDGQDVRNARFGPFSRNPWLVLARNFTGSAYLFNMLLVLAFFVPFILKILAYSQASAFEDTGLFEISEFPETHVWKEVLGGTEAPWLMGIALFLLAYNLLRYWLTHRTLSFVDEQTRSGHAPRLRDYWDMVQYERAFRLLFLFALGFFLWNFGGWLLEPLPDLGAAK